MQCVRGYKSIFIRDFIIVKSARIVNFPSCYSLFSKRLWGLLKTTPYVPNCHCKRFEHKARINFATCNLLQDYYLMLAIIFSFCAFLCLQSNKFWIF